MNPSPLSVRPAEILAGGRRLSDPQLSPDGNAVTFITSGPERSELALAQVGGGAEMWIPLDPGIASSRGGGHAWLPDGSGIAYFGKDQRLHVFDFSNWRTRAVTKQEEALSALAVSPDGRSAAYVVDTKDVVVVALDGESWPIRLTKNNDFAFDPTWSPDGRYIVWQEWDAPNMPWDGSRLVVRPVDSSEPPRVIAGGNEVGVQQPRFSPDGSQLAFLCDAHGRLNIWVMDVPSYDNARPLLEDELENGEPQWGSSQRSFVWTDGGASMLVTRNDRGRGLLTKRRVDDGTFLGDRPGRFTSLHAAAHRVVGSVTDVGRGPEIEVLDDSGAYTVARGPYAAVEHGAVEPEFVSWTSANGTQVPGRLYRTAVNHDGPPPLLVWVHGGPTSQSPATYFPRWTFFLERGWSVLVPDYRGTNGYGRAHLQALRGRWGEADVEDVSAGVIAAIDNGWGDARRTVVMGGSAGGLTTLMVMAKHPELCAAGVVLYPVVELFSLAKDTWRFEAHYLDTLIGSLPHSYEAYVDRSPITHVGAIQRPLLLLHGDRDEVVPVGQSIAMADRLRRDGKIVELHIYEGEGHGWKKPATTVDELERTERFLYDHVLHIARTS